MNQELITTLIGELQAKPGFKFVFKGGADVCSQCKLREACVMKLEQNTMYKVVEVLRKKHKCPLREGWVVVARVVEAEVEAVLDAKVAIEDAIITFKRKACEKTSCKFWSTCQSPYVKDGTKYKVLKVEKESVNCNGRKMVKVVLSRVKT
ncbi:MAG: UPF0179 family protein [Candidatus Nezhaarchaeales archaeon]|nr:MAG: hypothetical protein DSO05_05520 [Candidatus Nezhaarchaeota archaeon WYZ-LMO7]TDA36358.1 MAG: hypothetical protein DSO06_00580 [Candidatus Nezhaarchaeota archaeon WYZ-LMO8]